MCVCSYIHTHILVVLNIQEGSDKIAYEKSHWPGGDNHNKRLTNISAHHNNFL